MKFGFRFKTMLVIWLVAFVLITGISLANYTSTKKILERDYIDAQTKQLQIQASKLDALFQQAYLLCIKIRNDVSTQQQAVHFLEGSRDYDAASHLSAQLRSFLQEQNAISSVNLYLFDCKQVISSAEYYAQRELADAMQPSWSTGYVRNSAPFAPLFFQSQNGNATQRVYAYTAALEDITGKTIGTLCVTIDERDLYYAVLDPLSSAENEVYYLLTPQGLISSAKSIAEIGQRPEGIPLDLSHRMDAGAISAHTLYTSVEAPFSGYRLMSISNRNALTERIRAQKDTVLFVLCLIFILLLIAALIFSAWLSRPLHTLVTAIDQVGNGDFTTQITPQQSSDEFEAIHAHFNQMVVQINQLMDEVIQERTQTKIAELRALQYQIRPHFMYNTLNNILFSAKMQRNQVLAEQLSAFIALLEASVQRSGAFISLGEELVLVENYISLQKFRYFDCFTVDYIVAEDTKSCYVPCLLLQPVVENAVFHGIDPRRAENQISITAKTEGAFLLLSVQDNGSGMTEEQLARLLQEDCKDDQHRLTGIGIRNIRERLALYYQEQAQFTLSSAPESGTTASFRLPILRSPPDDIVE